MGDLEKVELKPCPFCGEDNVKAVIDEIAHDDLNAHVECLECGIEVRYSDCIRSAIDIWNKRKSRNENE